VAQGFTCPICMNDCGEGMHHPSGCTHVFCINCVKRLVWPTDCGTVKPSDFGWAGDDSEDDDFFEWLESGPGKAYDNVYDAEQAELERQRTNECPMCRRVVVPDWKTHTGKWSKQKLGGKDDPASVA